jgi:hypothetical protein
MVALIARIDNAKRAAGTTGSNPPNGVASRSNAG